ncbi:hypothetical protein EXU30_19675 [Shewanella maritima]|uniref:Site-specific integrase n=1 Tax=Shewanella maritima TaxID=2520507 RepID=A0A411PMB4_9GAMM|nr:site-specific integrase [Shewanella maritima]QBF84645.1 hypothetical protein EXU30_19675 [Shewanella maritima]
MATIKALPSGNYRAQVRLSGHKPTSKTFSTHDEALAWANQLEQQLRSEVKPVDVSVSSIGTILLNELKASTKDKYQYRLKPLVQYFGSRPLDVFTTQDLNQYIKYRAVSNGTVRAELQYLSRCMKYARAQGMISRELDIFKDYKLPKASKPRDRVLTEKEYNRILMDISPKVMPIVVILWETGMRRSEVLSITRDCINWDDKTLHLADTKNGEARDVPLSTKAVQVLNGVIQELNRLGYTRQHLFDLTAYSVSQAFRRSCDRLGIKGAVLHSLRHTACTRYAKKGLSIPQLQAVSGHKDYRSLQRYTHVQAKDVARILG